MKQKIDPASMTPELKEALSDWLYMVLDKSFTRKDYDYNKFKLDCALKKKTVRQAVVDGDLTAAGVDIDYANQIEGADLTEAYLSDEFSNLKTPILLKNNKKVTEKVRNICFPLSGNQIGINRQYDEFFDMNSINDFLPTADNCWNKILESENTNFQFQSVYESILEEGLTHAVWSIDHEYDELNEVVEPLAPGVQNIGLYPEQSDWRKSNRCFYVDVNFNQLIGRDDLDQEVLEKIRPQVIDSNREANGTKRAHRNQALVPFGKVRLVKFYCPSVYIDVGEESYYAEGLYAVALINPQFDPVEKDLPDHHNLYLLKVATDVPLDRSGLLLGTPVVNQPNQFFNLGLFYPWLDHQKAANGFYASATRLASYLTSGPFNSEKAGFGGVNSEDEDFSTGFKPFQVLKNKKYSSVFDASFVNFIETGFNTISKLEKDVQEGLGFSSRPDGIVNTGENVNAIVNMDDPGNVAMIGYAVRFNQLCYIPSLFTRVKNTQQILLVQIYSKLDEIKELMTMDIGEAMDMMPPDEMIVEQILEENKLFKRLVNTSGIKAKYREFYKKRQKELIENQQIAMELMSMEQQAMQQFAFAKSPIDIRQLPPPEESYEIVDGQEIRVELSPAEKEERKQAWLANEQMRRKEAEMQGNMTLLEIRKRQLAIEDISDIPPLSNVLLFNMLTAPIENSDIKISGVLAALLKNLNDRDLMNMVEYLKVIPQSVSDEVDYFKMFNLFTKGDAVTFDTIRKSEAQIAREEKARQNEADFQRQVSIEMAKNPGAQPPQIGQGNTAT